MKITSLILIIGTLLATSCTHHETEQSGKPQLNLGQPDENGQSEKIELNLEQLDENGLRGPPDGKVSLSYEFCIPDTARHREQVRNIDSTVEFYSSSPGRIGATKEQCLCIGHTHQPHPKEVLFALAELPYIERIIRCDFE